MLNKIASLLTGKGGGSRDNAGSREKRITIATCVLLLEMARADEEFALAESDKIRDILGNTLKLPADEIDEILAVAEREREESTDLWAYTNLINESFNKEEKHRLIEMIWGIAYSDGRLDQYEDYLIHKLANLLHIQHNDLIAAKLKVLGRG